MADLAQQADRHELGGIEDEGAERQGDRGRGPSDLAKLFFEQQLDALNARNMERFPQFTLPEHARGLYGDLMRRYLRMEADGLRRRCERD